LIEALGLDSGERDALLSAVHGFEAPDTHGALEARPGARSSIHPATAALPDTESPNLAELLRRHRLQARLTQDALAHKAGLSVRAISDLERRIRRFPHPDTLRRQVDALGLADSDRALVQAAAVRLGLPGQVPA
jgi:hypothetical protein